jgi:mannose-6-phosphate isomerase-like protein (cupin superfamily)
MHIRSQLDITHPLKSPSGENVFELIGASSLSGNACGHSLAYIVIEPGGKSSQHFHKVSEESYFILEGEALLRIDGQENRLFPGQACLILPQSTHEVLCVGSRNLVFIAVCTPPWAPGDSYTANWS